ncbi:MAG: 1,4-dihydroxy-2-naphthoate octaprenyltransferase [Prevotella sp.]|nr:1,4-dihydroxy-2-naphthoate octaprenyltransferase [Prevotella sp.]
MKTNSAKAWLLASRPKTLAGAAVPVMIALALAWADGGREGFKLFPAVLCMLFALVMQVDANFINDYFDFKKGVDDEQRLGPKRACAQGWVTLGAMSKAILFTTAMACLIGLPLVAYGGWAMVAVGVACVLFCFLYTTHLSYLGMGDLLVLVFFGLVPVCATYYLQRGVVTMEVVVEAVACGLVIDTLLVVNNYRDRENDRRKGKVTLVVRIGEKAAEWLFLALGVTACLMGTAFLAGGHPWAFILPLGYLGLHISTWKRMVAINNGRQLNDILGENARNMTAYGILTTIGLLL